MNSIGSILVVDDTHETLALLTKLLNDEGYITFSADSGELALVLLKNKIPDLILLDIRMPGVDGYEVCRCIKSNTSLCQIPVIFLSAATELNDRIEGFRVGAVDYIIKPFEKEELLTRVKTHLSLSILSKSLKEKNEEYETINEELKQSYQNIEQQNEEIKSSNEKLSIFNKTLEEKVNERTIILKEKNEEIEAQNEEYKQLNEELVKAKEKAEESDRLKTAFLSNMSHEIRTPLNIITGYTEFLADENLSKTERIEYINLINTNSTRLLNLINNILDLSKIESRQKIVEFKIFDINKLIEELFNQNKLSVAEKKLELFAHKGIQNKQALINSSEQLIYQIFSNLINNAIKYSPSGSIDFGYIVKDSELELFVKDKGIGISKEYISDLFKRFSQENYKLSRTYEGAGLGLSIVKGIVDLLNGNITVNSEKGIGTSFKITIPLINAIEVENEKSDSNIIKKEAQTNKKITLLIVEDDHASFQLLNKQILREFACEIIHAVNGNIAIEKINAHPDITCVLMDIHLPDIDGYETTKIIKKIKKELPVFAVTAAVMDIDKEKAFNSGCDEFFSKPVNREKLYEFITKYDNERKNQENISLIENDTFNFTQYKEKTLCKNEIQNKNNLTLEILNEKQITILIVEDDKVCFFLLETQISGEITCKIIHAINGLIAIEKVYAHPEITCVLMDLHMPGIDGCETTKRIKKIKKDLPVFAVTAATMEEAKDKAMNAGCDEFFSKPVDRNKLYDFIVKYDNSRQKIQL